MREVSENKHVLKGHIKNGLCSIENDTNWLDEYELWRNSDSNQFDSLLEIINPFDLSSLGDRHLFDLSDSETLVDLDIICMSAFLSERLLQRSKQAFSDIRPRQERNPQKILQIIDEYFGVVDRITNSQELAGCKLKLSELAEKQMVLYGQRSIDLYASFFSLKENLRKSSTESIYLQFTYWRITKSEESLNKLISSVADYLQSYFYEFDQDPEMHLYYPMDNLNIITRLAVIFHWCEHIAFHTDGIFQKYKELKWLVPADQMADDIIETNQISKYEMYLYQRVFATDDEETVRKKAICNHGYAIWVKTVDIMYIVCDIFQVLYRFTDEELRTIGTKRTAILEGYDNMTKVRNYYTGKVFFHQVYYQLERQYFDSQVLDALEEDAKIVAESVDDAIDFVSAIASDNIESLLQAKQKYITGLSEYISTEQEEKLDELIQQVVDKIKSTIQKLNVYDALYCSVSNEFLSYLTILMQYPQIFSSLVSAEYLYQQYVENKSSFKFIDRYN